MSESWVPAQSSERFTFLGALILGTTDLDVHCKIKGDSALTVAIKTEVILLVNEKLSDPKTQYSDLTLMAVMFMFCGEIVSGDANTCDIHEQGITRIVTERGGLRKLGIRGTLAVCVLVYVPQLTVLRLMLTSGSSSIFIKHCLQETTAPKLCTNFVPLKVRAISYQRGIPESPIYCPRDHFTTVVRSSLCTESIYELLSDMRDLTNQYFEEHFDADYQEKNQVDNRLTCGLGRISTSPLGSMSTSTSSSLRMPASENGSSYTPGSSTGSASTPASDKRPSEEPGTAFQTLAETTLERVKAIPPLLAEPDKILPYTAWILEACRITSLVFTTGLVLQVPFSEAANMLDTTEENGGTGTLSHIFTLFKIALENSNTNECWADMSGVLYWCLLIMGGAAHWRDFNEGWSEDDEMIRKYLAASTMRLSVLLCFEHPDPTTITLARLNKIQELLARESRRRTRHSAEVLE